MIFLLLISTFLIPTPQDAQSSPISIFSFQTDPSPVLVGQNFTYSIKVKNLDNKPIYVIPISRESFDPPDSVNIVKDYRPFISVLPEKLDPGEVATVRPHAFFSARRAGEVRIMVYVSWSYSEEYSMENPWYEISETSSFMIYESQQETYKIYFSTEPPDVGSITFSGTTYTSGQSGKYAAGTYQIEANVPKGYVFDGWLFYGTQYGGQPPPIEFEDPESPSTKVIIRGEGTIAAIFKWIVKLRGTIVYDSVNEYEIFVKIDELLLDTSGRLRLGEEVWVYNPAYNWQPRWVKEGDKVEVYGLGFCMGDPLCSQHGIVIKWPEHYVKKIEGEYPWPMFMHDPQHTGYSKGEGPDVLELLWKYPYSSENWTVFSSPVVADGRVYIIIRDGLLTLDAETGRKLWMSKQEIFSLPGVEGGRVYVVTKNGGLVCLDAYTGEVLWESSVKVPVSWVGVSLTVVDGMVYVNVEGHVYCFNSSNGELLWYKSLGIWSSPIGVSVAFGRAYVIGSSFSYNNVLYCLNASTGDVIWKKELPTTSKWHSIPVLSDGRLYIVKLEVDKEYLICLDAYTGDVIWDGESLGYVFPFATMGQPAVAYGKIYVPMVEIDEKTYGEIGCFDAKTGRLLWKVKLPGSPWHFPPAIADRKVYVFAAPMVVSLDAFTGDLVSKYNITTAWEACAPAIANGKVYVNTVDGVYCLGERASKVDVKFRGTVILVSPDYVDWKIKIEEILLDPIGELKVGEEIFVMAHNETFPNTGKPWVVGEPNVGDHVEVYGEYLSEPTPHVWAHKSYHYIKKIAGESTVLLIGKVLSHNINEEYTTIRVEKLLNCTKLNRIYLKVKDYETNFVEVSNSKCSWEREVEGKEVIVKWDKYYNEFYKISSIPPGTIIEFLGKLLKTGNEIYGQLKISDSIDYFIIPGVYFMVYIKSFTVNHDFDSWDKNYAANVYFKVNVKGVDDDADGSIDEDGEYVRLPTNTDVFRRWMGSVAWEILVHDNELGREIVGPKISDARSNIPYFPVPISIDIEVMDEDPGLDDLMARFPFRISEEELRRNDYKLCLARDSEDGKVRIELCLEPLLLRETGLLHNKQDTLDLELNFKDIKSIEAFNEFNNKRFEEVNLAIIEWDYPDVSIEWQVGRVDIWDCSNGGCEYVLPSVCQVGGKRDYADHASMTSGIIISRIDGKGPAGLGWNTRLMIIKASRNTLGKAIRLAVDEGAKVISLSIGTLEEDPELMPAVAYAINDNVVIVSAAGNDFTSRIDVLNKFKSIIKVAGVTRFVSSINQPKRLEWWWTGAFFSSAPYSNYGKFPTFNLDMELRIDFSSLSTIFNTTSIGCQYQLGVGTSSAAPILASIVALIQGYAKAKYGRYLTINEVYEVLRQASIDLGEPGWDPYYGWGLVDVKKALEVVEKGIPTPIYDITELPKPKSGTLIRMSSSGSQLLLHVVDSRGRILFGFSKNFAEIIAEKGVEHTVTENFTEVFLPFTSGMFRVLIDAGYSHQEVERVNLTIMTIKDDLLLAEWRASSLIERGKILSYNMRLDVERGVNVKEGINGDVNMDGVVDYKDLAMLAASYGRMENELEFNANADFNRDGIIDYKDLAILAANYGGRSS
jgi:outer membrane protein assembly factor BamB/subtilisin family serine protease